MKTLHPLILAALLGSSVPAFAQDTAVTGTVGEIHIGVNLACFTVAGQWYAIPTVNGTGFVAQADAMLLAHADGTPLSFLADSGVVYQCHSTQPALWAHDFDQ